VYFVSRGRPVFNAKRGLFFDENLHAKKESGILYKRSECLC